MTELRDYQQEFINNATNLLKLKTKPVYLVADGEYFLTFDIYVESSEWGCQSEICYELNESGSHLYSSLEFSKAQSMAERFNGVVVTR